MKSVGLVGLLRQALAYGDINACCGVLRRIYSETLQEEDPVAAVVARSSTSSAAAVMHSGQQQHPLSSTPNSLPFVHRALGEALHSPRTEAVDENVASRNEGGSSASVASPSPPAATSLVDRVLELGRVSLQDSPQLVKSSSVSLLCHTALRSGEWAEALRFCEHLHQQPPPPTFLASVLRPGNVSAVTAFCEERGWAVDITSAMRVLSDQGSWVDALALAQDAERRFALSEPYTLGVLVPFLAARGAGKKAAALFDEGIAQGALVEPELVSHMVAQTASPSQMGTCLHMLRTLVRVRESSQLLPSTSDFFRRIIEASPSWHVSLEVFHIARSCDVRPDQRTVSLLLAQCDAAGAWAAATRLYDLAVRENFVDSLALGSTYHTLVRAFSAVRQWEKALEALSWMSKASEASTAAGKCELVELCEQAGQWEAALAVGQTLLESNLELLPTQTALSLLFACAKGAQWQLATRIFTEQLADVRVQPHPLSVCAALQACIAAERWVEALNVFHSARAQQPRVVLPPMAHRLVIKACVGQGRWSEAIMMLTVMGHDGLPLDNHGQRLGMWAAALHGQWELSLSFLRGIPVRSRTPQDRLVVRGATRFVSPDANAAALKYLQRR